MSNACIDRSLHHVFTVYLFHYEHTQACDVFRRAPFTGTDSPTGAQMSSNANSANNAPRCNAPACVKAMIANNANKTDPDENEEVQNEEAECVVCENINPGVSEFQRCEGGCNRWFCIEGDCKRRLGIKNYTKAMSGGDLVCRKCRKSHSRALAGVARRDCLERRRRLTLPPAGLQSVSSPSDALVSSISCSVSIARLPSAHALGGAPAPGRSVDAAFGGR